MILRPTSKGDLADYDAKKAISIEDKGLQFASHGKIFEHPDGPFLRPALTPDTRLHVYHGLRVDKEITVSGVITLKNGVLTKDMTELPEGALLLRSWHGWGGGYEWFAILPEQKTVIPLDRLHYEGWSGRIKLSEAFPHMIPVNLEDIAGALDRVLDLPDPVPHRWDVIQVANLMPQLA